MINKITKIKQYVVEGIKYVPTGKITKKKTVIADSFENAIKIASNEDNFVMTSISLVEGRI